MDPSLADLEKVSSTESAPTTTKDLVAHQWRVIHRKQHAETVGARNPQRISPPGLSIGGGKPFPEQLPASDKYVVDFEGSSDVHHPQNWSLARK